MPKVDRRVGGIIKSCCCRGRRRRPADGCSGWGSDHA